MTGFTQLFVLVLTVVSLVDAARNDFCNVKRCGRGQHTMCQFSPKPAAQCGTVKSASLSRKEINEVLQAHNRLRAFVASGRETRGAPGPQPAGNIEPLRWDTKLADIAQRWANQCEFKHDTCRNVDRFDVNQNIAFSSWPNKYDRTLSQLVQGWYDEVKDFDGRIVKSYKFDYKMTTHYTQMIWGKTTSIGCGLVRYIKDNLYTIHLVCNYGPMGNMQGEPVYETC